MPESEIIIYKSEDGSNEIQVRLEGDIIWLSQRQMSELFEKDSDTIGLHLKNIYDSKELEEGSTTEYSSVVQSEGQRQVRRKIKLYNLDAIISVGYRVNSIRGTQFRMWANKVFLLNTGGSRMLGQSLWRRLRCLVLKAEINHPERVTLHNLRHSIATHLLDSGVSIEQVRDFLGHTNLESTQGYTRVGRKHLGRRL